MSTCSATQNLHHPTVRLKRRTWLISLACAAIAFVLFLSLTREREPEYQGRRLSEWIDGNGNIPSDEAREAMQGIGTNALPYLLKWIAYEGPAWRTVLIKNLPSFTVKSGAVPRWARGAAIDRAYDSISGFGLLGTNAISAIPELEALLKDTTDFHRSSRAMLALGAIGEPAIPALKAAFADTSRSNRVHVLNTISLLWTETKWPIIAEALTDRDINVREAATNFATQIPPRFLTNAPPNTSPSDPRKSDSKQKLEKICVYWTGVLRDVPQEAIFVSKPYESDARAWVSDSLFRDWGVLLPEEAAAVKKWELSIELTEESKGKTEIEESRTGYVIEFSHSDNSVLRVFIGTGEYALRSVVQLNKILSSDNQDALVKIERILAEREKSRTAPLPK